MASLKEIKGDMDAVNNGRWNDWYCGIRLLVASIHNSDYKDARSRALKPHLKKIRSGQITPETLERILKPVVAKHILKDWSGYTSDDGVPIAYSPEEAMKLFNDPEVLSLYDDVLVMSGETSDYLEAFREDGLGNS
jgi:hypothetical protein